MWLVNVAQRNGPLTMLFFNSQLIHRFPHGLHGLTILDDGTIEWLLDLLQDVVYPSGGLKELASDDGKKLYQAFEQIETFSILTSTTSLHVPHAKFSSMTTS